MQLIRVGDEQEGGNVDILETHTVVDVEVMSGDVMVMHSACYGVFVWLC